MSQTVKLHSSQQSALRTISQESNRRFILTQVESSQEQDSEGEVEFVGADVVGSSAGAAAAVTVTVAASRSTHNGMVGTEGLPAPIQHAALDDGDAFSGMGGFIVEDEDVAAAPVAAGPTVLPQPPVAPAGSAPVAQHADPSLGSAAVLSVAGGECADSEGEEVEVAPLVAAVPGAPPAVASSDDSSDDSSDGDAEEEWEEVPVDIVKPHAPTPVVKSASQLTVRFADEPVVHSIPSAPVVVVTDSESDEEMSHAPTPTDDSKRSASVTSVVEDSAANVLPLAPEVVGDDASIATASTLSYEDADELEVEDDVYIQSAVEQELDNELLHRDPESSTPSRSNADVLEAVLADASRIGCGLPCMLVVWDRLHQ